MGHSSRSLLGFCFLIAFASVGPAAAQSVSLHWDDCTSFSTNKQFIGPIVYRQVVSGFGFDAPMRGYSIRIRITMSNVYNTPYAPPADA